MKYVLVNYHFDPSWVKEYADDYLILDDSESEEWVKDIPQDKVLKGGPEGNADYSKLMYLVDNYDNLPDVFVWGKSNLFKYISKEEFDLVKDNKIFTPLLTMNHKVYSDNNGPVCYYAGGMYWERNNSWYLTQQDSKYFRSYGEFAQAFQLPNPPYLPFPPGGNFILTKDTVHKYSQDFYKKMASVLPYANAPGEAQMLERSYYTLWK